MARFLFHTVLFLALTMLTQIGGLVYLLAWALTYNIDRFYKRWFYHILLFLMLYAGAAVSVRYIAPVYGRVPLDCLGAEPPEFRMQSPLYCLLNRNYVRPGMRALAQDLAIHMNQRYPGTVTLGLDAGFPFFDGFPLFPHLSHDDGRKLDLAFYYMDGKARYVPGRTASPIGYWAFEEGEGTCPEYQGLIDLRWDMAWFQRFNQPFLLDETRTVAALAWLREEGGAHGLSAIFLEPHLVKKWGIGGGMVRFQGCNAARHDDHIHLQLADPEQ